MSAMHDRAVWAAQSRIDTPLGPMLLARTARGLAGAWFEHQRHHPAPWVAPMRPDDPLLASAAQQLDEYFRRERTRFALPLDLHGTAFQTRVWQALLAIEHGRLGSYAQVAVAVGQASAARAAGGAIGRNPVSIIVPCHRVLGRAGALTGYAGGIERKRALLELEGAWPMDAQRALPM